MKSELFKVLWIVFVVIVLLVVVLFAFAFFLLRSLGTEVNMRITPECVNEVSGYVSLESKEEAQSRRKFYVKLQDTMENQKLLCSI